MLVGKPEVKRPLGRPRRRWDDNIKTDFRGIGCEGVDWTYLAQKRARWWVLCEEGNEHSGSIKCGEFLYYLRNSQLVKKDSGPWTYLFIYFVTNCHILGIRARKIIIDVKEGVHVN